MNNLMMFENKPVEVFEWNGQVLFNPKHVAECLDIKNVNDNISKMNEKQVIKLTNSKIGKADFRKLHNTGENFLTESGVYKLIFKSHKAEAEKFQDWVTDEVLPSIRRTGSYNVESKDLKEKEIEARYNNSLTRKANLYLKIAALNSELPKEYVQVLQSKAAETLNDGNMVIPLPKVERKTYTAAEIGEKLGITANKVGRLANENNLKTEEYGMEVWDKSKYSNKEVPTFRYYEEVIPVLEEILN